MRIINPGFPLNLVFPGRQWIVVGGNGPIDPDAAALGRRFIGHQNLRWRHALYKLTNNPIFAWEAYRDAVDSGLPVPGWVSDYLLRAAKRISALEPTGRKTRDAMIEAFEPQGQGRESALTQAREHEDRVRAYRIYHFLRNKVAMSDIEAREAIAQELESSHGSVDGKVSEKTIQRWIAAIDKVLASIPE